MAQAGEIRANREPAMFYRRMEIKLGVTPLAGAAKLPQRITEALYPEGDEAHFSSEFPEGRHDVKGERQQSFLQSTSGLRIDRKAVRARRSLPEAGKCGRVKNVGSLLDTVIFYGNGGRAVQLWGRTSLTLRLNEPTESLPAASNRIRSRGLQTESLLRIKKSGTSLFCEV